jgi:hypothetical protein
MRASEVSSMTRSSRYWSVLFCTALIFVMCPSPYPQNLPQVRVIAFGAHPDDCDVRAGGLAAKYAAKGYKVKFVSVTNGVLVQHHPIQLDIGILLLEAGRQGSHQHHVRVVCRWLL